MNTLLSIAKAFFFIAVGAALAYVLWAGSDLRFQPSDALSPSEFVAIILTALGVILAALAVFLGGLAIVSWRQFDERVKFHVENYLEKSTKNSNQLQEILKTIEKNNRKNRARLEGELGLENESAFDEDVV